jgi:hypothetical protein
MREGPGLRLCWCMDMPEIKQFQQVTANLGFEIRCHFKHLAYPCTPTFSAIALRIMAPSKPEATKSTAMPIEPSTPEICDRPLRHHVRIGCRLPRLALQSIVRDDLRAPQACTRSLLSPPATLRSDRTRRQL